MVKQSSPAFRTVWKRGVFKMAPRTLVGKFLSSRLKNICGHAFGITVPSTLPKGEVRAWGGFRRRFPTGGFAKGMLLKVSTSPDFPAIVAAGEGAVTVGAALFSS